MDNTNTYKLYTDGSYRMQTNTAGFGGYVEDSSGQKIFEFSETINNPKLFRRHEEMGLKRGLELCLEKGIKNLICYSDANENILILNTKEKEVQNFYTRSNKTLQNVVMLAQEFESINFTYLPRVDNKYADKLSHKEMNKVAGKVEQVMHFATPTLDTVRKYKTKEAFTAANNQLKDFLVFNVEKINNLFEAYYATKTEKGIDYKLIGTAEKKEPIVNCITDFITHTLKTHRTDYPNNTEIGIFCVGNQAYDFEHMIKGQVPLTKKVKKSFHMLQETLDTYSRVAYQLRYEVEQTIFGPKGKKPTTKEDLVAAMKELGDENYYIGKNKELERFAHVQDSKRDDIASIQKKYFSEFLKIALLNDADVAFKVLPKDKAQRMENKMTELKEELVSQGVRLRL